MYKYKEILAIIPARGGSKGIPRKNLRKLGGKPLVAWTIEAALRSDYIDRVVVSTDDEEIAEVSKKAGADVVIRPHALATDESPTEHALINALEQLRMKDGYSPDFVMLLQPTSPLRRKEHIDESIRMLLDGGSHDSLLSVKHFSSFIWKKAEKSAFPVNYDYRNRPRRQDKDPEYEENGAIYLTKTDLLEEEKNRLGGVIELYVMDVEDSIEIDNESDFRMCETILEKRKK